MGIRRFFKPEKESKSASDAGNIRKDPSPATDVSSITPPLPSPNPFLGTDEPSTTTTSQRSSGAVSPLRFSQREGGATASNLDALRNHVMINYLYQQQGNNGWRSEKGNRSEGVILRSLRDSYYSHPPEFNETPLAASLRTLNVQSAMTIFSPVIRSYLQSMPNSLDIPLLNGLAVQVVANVEQLATARIHQCAACIASEALLVVWDDDAVNLLKRAKTIEWELMQLLWTSGPYNTPAGDSKADLSTKERETDDPNAEESASTRRRPVVFINTILVSMSLAVMIGALGLGARELVIEIRLEEDFASNRYLRLVFLVLTPVWMFLGMFFFNSLVANVARLVGPVQQMTINSRHYSAKCVPRLTRDLPHVTIQCPVYKESLTEVIMPTIRSIKQAISTYELQGGSANIFVNDDGLQVLGEEARNERILFYADNGIGWVARPPHSNAPNGFKRKGKFKKASNMNFALAISCAMEEKLLELQRNLDWSSTNEAEATALALEQSISDGGGIAWADGNIRVGDYILIVDSDTRVPLDCLLDAVSELEASPEVGILQFSSGVMQVTKNFFENGITFFTNLIYTSIRNGVANGDVAPFVGHNAMLRWSALQDVAYEEDDRLKFWSESHVSEDFDMALRLQIKGYITRLAAWANDGFEEGVSLTVYDELARWQKYAYGCNELVFHPIRFWIFRGPLTPLFRKFLWSNMAIAAKINIIAYIGTYYAIGIAWFMSLANYFIIGWFNGYVDKYYMNSWKIWITVVIVFTGLGNLSLAVFRYRTGEKGFMSSLFENIKWILMFSIFLGGISLHVSQAILAHMFEVDMTWGATAKTLEFTNFFYEVPKTLRKFWFSFSFCIVVLAGMAVLACAPFIPYSWDIPWTLDQLQAVVPLAVLVLSHLLLPLVLNPGLMTFAW